MRERLEKKSLFKILFALSLIISFLFTAFWDPPSRAFFEALELVSGLYFSFGLAAWVLYRIRFYEKTDKFLVYLITFLVLAICFVLVGNKAFSKILGDILTLALLPAFLMISFLILKIPVRLIQKHRRFLISKKFLTFVFSLVFLTGLFFFSRHYYFLQKRVHRLEEIAGPKKLVCDEKKSVEEIKKSVVRIVGIWGEGSGFFVDEEGVIVTNHHVIAYDPNPKIVLPDYSLVQGEVVMADSRADIALVKVEGKKAWPKVNFILPEKIEPMEELISVGYPLGTDLKGEATAIKGRFVALREVSEIGVRFVQTDISLNSGASGGPMINLCGDVVAINTAGLAGLGMGVSMADFESVLRDWEMDLVEEPLRDVEKIDFNPDGSPRECVEAFYNYQTVGKLKEAYELLSKNYTDWPFEKWQEGYQNTLNIIILAIEEDEEDKNRVFVKFSSADLIGEDIVYRYFEGTVEVVEIEGHLKLDGAEIEEIEDPDWEWFYGEK